MFGLSTSQSIASVLILVFIVLYFAANNGLKQNAFIYMFGLAVVVLIVDCLFMNDRTFDYEPQYENWQKRQASD